MTSSDRRPGSGAAAVRAGAVVGLAAMLVAGGLARADAAAVRFGVVPDRSTVAYVSGTQLGEFQGSTSQLGGEVLFDGQAPERTQVTMSVNPQGLRSDNAQRDQHLHQRVLDVARFPAVTFTTREFRPAPGINGGGGEGVLVGTLGLHGVERPVQVPVRFVVEGSTLRGQGTFVVKLADFDITPPRLLGLKVHDQVTVQIQLVAAGR